MVRDWIPDDDHDPEEAAAEFVRHWDKNSSKIKTVIADQPNRRKTVIVYVAWSSWANTPAVWPGLSLRNPGCVGMACRGFVDSTPATRHRSLLGQYGLDARASDFTVLILDNSL